MNEISFTVNNKHSELIQLIAERAANAFDVDLMDIAMSITAVHVNDMPLDLRKLLTFNSTHFGHDIRGIENNINKETGKLENCFIPRCIKK